jgi:hypothetical protein
MFIFDNVGSDQYRYHKHLEDNLEKVIEYGLANNLHGTIAEVKAWPGDTADVDLQNVIFEYWRKNMWRVKYKQQSQNRISCHWAALRFLSAMMTNEPFSEGDPTLGTKLGWNSFSEMQVAGAMAVQFATIAGEGRAAVKFTDADVDAVTTLAINATRSPAARRSLVMTSLLKL